MRPFVKMLRQKEENIIERTIRAINQLPADKAEEISNFADFISKRYKKGILTEGIEKLTEEGKSFQFLYNEEDLYSADDLKEMYKGQRIVGKT